MSYSILLSLLLLFSFREKAKWIKVQIWKVEGSHQNQKEAWAGRTGRNAGDSGRTGWKAGDSESMGRKSWTECQGFTHFQWALTKEVSHSLQPKCFAYNSVLVMYYSRVYVFIPFRLTPLYK